MKHSVTSIQMKEIDQITIEEVGIPSMVLMERAALAVTREVEHMANQIPTSMGRPIRIWVACGTGNNGADGIAVGRMLHQKGYEVTVLLTGDLTCVTTEHKEQQRIAHNLSVPMTEYSDFIPGSCDVIVDAIFGIGLSRPMEGEYKSLIQMLKEQKTKHVVAVDIPSGICGDTGSIQGAALPAEVTVTFGQMKTGLLLYPGKDYAGEVQVVDIGLSQGALITAGWDGMMLESEDLYMIPKRSEDSNKGTYGKLLVIAGSKGMSGAAYLSALAAYRTGIGLVKILTVEANGGILQAQLPEAIIKTYDETQIWENEDAFREYLEAECDWASSIILGPGIGTEPYVKLLVETVMTHAYVPMVLDADALNTIAMYSHLSGYYTENIVITPHVGEMSRLTGMGISEIKAHPIAVARDYSCQHGIVCVLKDAVTVIADKDGDTYINTSGNSGMAKAGSGDVLTGIIGALAAQGMELKEAAAYGVFLHGLAGDQAAVTMGNRSLLAHEIADTICQILKEPNFN